MSDYSRKRYEERVGNIGNITVSPDLTRDLRAQGTEFTTVKEKVMDLISAELESRLQRILSKKFSDLTFVVPVLAVKLWVGENSDFVKIYTKALVYKKDGSGKYVRDAEGNLIPTGERVYIGEKFYVPIVKDYIETLLLYPISKTEKDIAETTEEHGIRKNKGENVRVMPLDDSSILNIEVTPEGEVKEKTFGGSDGFIDYTSDQQWAISEGRKIKFFSKASNDFIEATIVELIEPVIKKVKDASKKTNVIWLGPEKLIKVKLDTGKGIPTMKTFKVDDIVYLPVGVDGEMIKCKIVSPTYVLDERSNNPVNLKYRPIQ